MQKPSIGRKVWVWGLPGAKNSADQAFDASIVYVWSDSVINISYNDHNGYPHHMTSVTLRDPEAGDNHGTTAPVATWMPYQKQQHESQIAKDMGLAAS